MLKGGESKRQRNRKTARYAVDVVVDYGDPSAYQQMQRSFSKLQNHRDALAQYKAEALVYGTQHRPYELTAEDVSYFGLDGREPDDE